MKRTLLIVDDVKSNRNILKNMLCDEYNLLEASHGNEALAVMTSEFKQISAVLLDLVMPIMDGYEVLDYMQKDTVLSQLPVIVTTGQTDAGSEEHALSLGAKDYVSKPYKSAIIKQRIRNTIKLRETSAMVNALQRDRLTGLLSREAFFERVAEVVSQKESGYYVMACFDVNKFKVINDQYGTKKGDEVLRHIAAVFRNGFEAIGGFCCRISADNFAMLYPSSFKNSKEIVEIRDKSSSVSWLVSPLTFSIGRYTITEPEMPPSAMYDRAIIAADSIRGRYDTRIAEYDEPMRSDLIHEQEIVTEMESALLAGNFEVWYQPQYNHSTGALIGAEALVRWRHPQKGLIPPGTFIPVFEQNGFIYSLDKFVWEEACRFLRSELDSKGSSLPVSVNVSRYDAMCPEIVSVITGLVEKYNIPVELFRLEITESAFSDSTSRIISVVKELIARGFTLEIDDFGSGYSSLNTLKNVPAQVVKLDMKFLEDDEGSQRGGNIIESVVRMAKWLGMSVIAEGVEKKDQADFLRSVGCNYIQGYYYSKPLPGEDYEKLCDTADREEKLLAMETVENLDNNAFWNPSSMDTLIFNSYVGAACIYEYSGGKVEMLRATEKYAQIIGGAGITIEDALKINWAKSFDESSGKRFASAIEVSIATKKEVTGEYVFLDLPGCPHETYLRSTIRVIASAGEQYLVYCISENVTAQRQAEQRGHRLTEQLQAVLDNVHCGITAVIPEGNRARFVINNDKYFSILGYTKKQYQDEIGKDSYTTVFPEDRERIAKIIKHAYETGETATVEYRAVQRDGSVIWLRSNVSEAAFDGIEEKVQLMTYVDISANKKAEQELRDASAQLQSITDDMPGGFMRLRVLPDGTVKPLFFNKGFCAFMGMEPEKLTEIYRKNPFFGVKQEDVPSAQQTLLKMLESGETQNARCRILKRDGSFAWFSVFGSTTTDETGNKHLNIYYLKIDSEISAEEHRKELLDNLPYGAALYTFDGTELLCVHLNKRYWELLEKNPGEYYNYKDFMKAVHPDDVPLIISELCTAIRENRDFSYNVRILSGAGDYRLFHILGRIVDSPEGKHSIYAIYIPTTSEGISFQEMLPAALDAMMSVQTDYFFVKDKNLCYICCSGAVAKLFGCSSEKEVIGKCDEDFFEKEFADALDSDEQNVLKTGISIIDKIDRLPSVDGTDIFASTSKFPLKDFSGNIIGIYGIGRDITEVRAIRSQFELLTNSIPCGIATYEFSGGKLHLTYFNDGFCTLFEVNRGEYEKLSAKDALAGVFDEDIPEFRARLETLVLQNSPLDYVYRIRLKSGGYKWINMKASSTEQSPERVVFNAVLLDVTQRQELTERLRMSEEESRLTMQRTGSTVCRYDIRRHTMSVPETARKKYLLDKSIERLPESSIESGDVSSDTINDYKAFYDGINSGIPSGVVTFRYRLHGEYRWLEAHHSTIFLDSGEPVYAIISFSDITEQLEKDAAYQRWQQSLLNKSPESYSLFRYNISKNTVFGVKEGSLLRTNFLTGEFNFDSHMAEYVSNFVFDEDKEQFSEFIHAETLLSNYYQGKRIAVLEYRETADAESFRWLRLTVDMVERQHSGEVEAYLLFENIDAKKREELATRELAESDSLTGVLNRAVFALQVNDILKNPASCSSNVLMMLDIDGFKQVNDAFGHGAGDDTLIDVADALRSILRGGDLVGRLGGDEFLIFFRDIPSDVVAANKARQICALTRKSFSIEVEISGSVGIAVAPKDGNDFETLYKKADDALYYVKGTGKDNFAFYHEEMSAEHSQLKK